MEELGTTNGKKNFVFIIFIFRFSLFLLLSHTLILFFYELSVEDENKMREK